MIAAVLVVIALGVVTVLFVRNWPFTHQAVISALQDRFARTVEIHSFRRTYFPPGFVAEGISFEHRKRKDLPPLITVRTLIVKASYIGMLRPQKHLDEVKVVGLHVTVPPKNPNGQPSPVMPLTDSNKNDTLAIGEISTDDAVLEFMASRAGGDPFKMDIHRLTLSHVGGSGSITFRASLENTEPPGEIHSTGQVGPWNEDDPGSTPVSGSYNYESANLGVFEGIAGTLSSKGKFGGTLGRIETEGAVNVPDFRVSGSKHTVQLSSEFRALVDGTNGDTYLQAVKSHFERTTALASGRVTGQPGQAPSAMPRSFQGKPEKRRPRAHSARPSPNASAKTRDGPGDHRSRAIANPAAGKKARAAGSATTPSGSAQANRSASTRKAEPIHQSPARK